MKQNCNKQQKSNQKLFNLFNLLYVFLPLDGEYTNEIGVMDILIPTSWFVYIMHVLSQNQLLSVNCILQIYCVTTANLQARGNNVNFNMKKPRSVKHQQTHTPFYCNPRLVKYYNVPIAARVSRVLWYLTHSIQNILISPPTSKVALQYIFS